MYGPGPGTLSCSVSLILSCASTHSLPLFFGSARKKRNRIEGLKSSVRSFHARDWCVREDKVLVLRRRPFKMNDIVTVWCTYATARSATFDSADKRRQTHSQDEVLVSAAAAELRHTRQAGTSPRTHHVMVLRCVLHEERASRHALALPCV